MSAWSREAAIEALQIVESEPEYPDAEACWPNVKQDLIDNGVSHSELVFDMIVQIARATVVTTKRCIAERLRAVTGVAADAKPTLAEWVFASEGSDLGRPNWEIDAYNRLLGYFPEIGASVMLTVPLEMPIEVDTDGAGTMGSATTPAGLRTILDTLRLA